MRFFKVFFCAVAFSIITASCWAVPIEITAWFPDKSQLKNLAPDVTLGKYQIQPPKDYIALHTLSGPNSSDADAWGGLTRADGTRPYVMLVRVIMPTTETNKYTLKQISVKMLSAVERRRKGWKQSPTEQGTINSLTFMRTYWLGTDVANGQPIHGFSYVAKDGNILLQLSSQDFEPYQKSTLPLAEASVLTFKKQ